MNFRIANTQNLPSFPLHSNFSQSHLYCWHPGFQLWFTPKVTAISLQRHYHHSWPLGRKCKENFDSVLSPQLVIKFFQIYLWNNSGVSLLFHDIDLIHALILSFTWTIPRSGLIRLISSVSLYPKLHNHQPCCCCFILTKTPGYLSAVFMSFPNPSYSIHFVFCHNSSPPMCVCLRSSLPSAAPHSLNFLHPVISIP